MKMSEQKKEAEKRAVEKVKQDITDLTREAKKPKLEDSAPKKKAESLFLKEFDDTSTDDSNDKQSESTDADDFAMEMGLACVLCRQLDVAPGNQLVECQECHNLYHQKCHKPAATDADVNDPRVVWYCTRCSRNIKKMASKQKTKAAQPSSSSKDSGKRTDEERKKEPSTLVPFKRSEANIVSTKSSASASLAASHQPLVGLASLAANLSGKSATTKTSTSSNSSGKTTTSSFKTTSNIVSSKNLASQMTKSSASFMQSSKSLSSGYPSSSVSKSQQSKTNPSSSASSSSSTSSASSRGVSSATSTANAMKRLQMMKKKAAKR
ncbi:integrator complex subunit 12-like [Saccoglossus kowalevskii]